MPKRTDIHKILLIGSGPIIIGQACEFDYSGTQACKSLRDEGYEVVLVNSNPATIMTDPETADRTYIEPITVPFIESIIAAERPDALLPTLGGQTGLNVAIELAEQGVLDRHGVEMIGANAEVIRRAEDRDEFKVAMAEAGLLLPKSQNVKTLEAAETFVQQVGLPVVIRPSFTLGGTGGGVAHDQQELREIVERGLNLSPVHSVLIEESVIGWGEFELEVMRDHKDNVVIVCSIENIDSMGVHTGDSITVAPAQTLTDRGYQIMRDAAIKAIRAIGVETGGSNIQFAVNPSDGRMVIIEMNPRVSRSSALASKATGFPIAKIAAKLAVGMTLDEIPNDITQRTPACFEPTIDYCVVKIPRFDFAKFPAADPRLTTQMKSVGETMAIGRTFKEALQKGLRGLETGHCGLQGVEGYSARQNDEGQAEPPTPEEIETRKRELQTPSDRRIFQVRRALQRGFSVDEVAELTLIDPWFVAQLNEIVQCEAQLREGASTWQTAAKALTDGGNVPHAEALAAKLMYAKQYGFSDQQLASCWGVTTDVLERLRRFLTVDVQYKIVDTCAAEFEALTPYYYSAYEHAPQNVGSGADTAKNLRTPSTGQETARRKVMILGGGPNRIGQGIEFDYCCVHAAYALREMGHESIMVNCNPETVSTDYDTSDRLYFEPLTHEDILNIVEQEQPDGLILQFGGQTPLNLAGQLEASGVPILGTSPAAINRAEDREQFKALLEKLGLRQPPNGIARSIDEAVDVAGLVGYPVVVRPSFVLGGRAMEIVFDDEQLRDFLQDVMAEYGEHPILIDRFLEDATEVDVDMVADGSHGVVGGMLEHIEEAGVHSGDSAMVLPPFTLSDAVQDDLRRQTLALAMELGVVGLMNVQYAVKGEAVYVLEVNPRASRTIPFISKAIGVPLAKHATKAMLGSSLSELQYEDEVRPRRISVKESVFPFVRFPGVDIMLGPEMRSTGEVMGTDDDFGRAFVKSQLAAGQVLPCEGLVFVSVMDRDKPHIIPVAQQLVELGLEIIGTAGTVEVLSDAGIQATSIQKIQEGEPNILNYLRDGRVALVINTPSGRRPRVDEVKIRSLAVSRGVPCVTTVPGAMASVSGIEALQRGGLGVQAVQDWYGDSTSNQPPATQSEHVGERA